MTELCDFLHIRDDTFQRLFVSRYQISMSLESKGLIADLTNQRIISNSVAKQGESAVNWLQHLRHVKWKDKFKVG